MASRAGLSVMNLEFIQFHPTTLHSQRRPLSDYGSGSWEGAKLIDSVDDLSLKNITPLADLAPRDVVAGPLTGK